MSYTDKEMNKMVEGPGSKGIDAEEAARYVTKKGAPKKTQVDY